MSQPSIQQGQVIDLTGLPEEAAQAVRTIVHTLRQYAAAPKLPATSPDEWQRLFDAYLREVAARATCYPQGFVLDDSREAIYESRGE